MTTGEDAGDIAAPVVAGLLWTAWGAPAVLLARAALAVAAEIWALWLTRSERPSSTGHGAESTASSRQEGGTTAPGGSLADGR